MGGPLMVLSIIFAIVMGNIQGNSEDDESNTYDDY